MKLKYVVGTIGGVRGAILFNENIVHRDAARCCFDVTGAGFYYATDDEVIVYGESISLNVKSNPEEDARLVGEALGHPAYARY